MKHILILLSIFLALSLFPSYSQEFSQNDSLLYFQRKAQEEAFLADVIKRRENEKVSKVNHQKQTTSSLPVTWKPRGPKKLSEGFLDFIFDANDTSGKKAWLATLGGLWYNIDLPSDSSWHKIDAVSDYIYSLAQNPTNSLEIAVSSDKGLYITSDGGNSWSLVSNKFSHSLAYNINGDLFYRNHFEVKKFNRSTNLFESFLEANITFWEEINPEISSLHFDHEGLIYVGLANGKIYRSSSPNGGVWANIMSSPLASNSFYTDFCIAKDNNDNKILYAINTKQSNTNSVNWLRKSTNGGNSWLDLSIPTTQGVHFFLRDNTAFYVDPSDPNKIAMYSGVITYSTNGGTSWNTTSPVSYIRYGYNNHLVSSPSGSFAAVSSMDIDIITGIFSGNSITSEERKNDINTASISPFEFINNYKDSIYFFPIPYTSNDWAFSGVNYLEPILGFQNTPNNLTISDKNEPNLNFVSVPSLRFFNREGEFLENYLDIGSIFGHRIYDEMTNTFYGYKFSSEINNQTILYRVSGVGSGNEKLENLLIGKYFESPTLYVLSKNELLLKAYESNSYKIYRLKIQEDNTVLFNEITLPTNIIEEIKTDRTNSNLIFFCDYNSGLYYSEDKGLTWNNKTGGSLTGVSYYALNPSNPEQVFIVSDYQLYVTNTFLSTTPTWLNITGNLPLKNLYWIKYRESDGQLIISVPYGGIYSTNYFQNSVPDSIIYANYPRTLCVNEPFKVTFYRNGAFSENNSYELWLSDANGDFSNATKIGDSETSPIYGQIPNNTPSGTDYQIRVLSTNTAVPIIRADSEPIEIGQGTPLFLPDYPKAINETNNGFVLNAPVNQNAEVWYVVVPEGNPGPNLEQFISGKDSSGLAYLVADSINAITNESNPLIITGLLAGNNYDVYVATKLPYESCFSSMSKLTVNTIGNPVNYCTPIHTNGCTGDHYISEVVTGIGYSSVKTVLNPFNSGCSGSAYTFNSKNIETIITGINEKTLQIRLHDFKGSFPQRQLGVWIDLNNDGDFEDSNELLRNNPTQNNPTYVNLLAHITSSPGIKRLRIRVIDTEENSNPMSPCNTYISGETEDYLVNVETNEPYIFANLDKESVGQCEVIKVVMEVTGSYNSGNLFQVELSDSTGNFADSTVLLSGLSATLPVNIQVPNSIPSGANYKLRVVSTNPVAITYESAGFSIKPNNKDVLTDYTSGSVQVSQIGTITGKNNIQGTSRIDYKAWNSVILSPAFEASPSSGGTFKAEIVGCDN
ncbi:GEVED domain-containing protein [Arcticibacterium luteifluviistationis]|uniref:GEVED domain-containing protein n=1 Tax=Arcticibacterium luteifluviistationis TaxID=1784714 RepID=A0A2Z4GEZ6_9BACT|nr:GEVED domain-containing protein [Arcticibacterium luteifluviistationis]AWV99731.1 hypothetical protein DJ013_16745 [Arcticibacterium luteifluviistationis]